MINSKINASFFLNKRLYFILLIPIITILLGFSPDFSSNTTSLLVNSTNLPFSEDFEAGVPPANWQVINPDNLEGWEMTNTTGSDGNSTNVARMDNHQYNAPGEKDYLVLPALDLSVYCTPTLIFDVAYAALGPNNSEQLDIEYSTDGGQNFAITTYSKGYSELPTVSDQSNSWQPQEASHWRMETVDLSSYASSNTIFRFVQTNNQGNGLYIDNVRIVDNCPASFTADKTLLCANENVSFTYLSGVATAWTWNFSPSTVTFQNGTTANSPHPVVSFDAIGGYDVTLTTTTPSGDVSTTKTTYIIRTSTTTTQPFEEKFESGVPPANWLVINPDNSEGWESTTTVGIDGNTSNVARMDNYQYNAPGQKDYLVMPQIDLSPYCNPTLVFEVAYAAYGPDNSEQLDVEYAAGCNTDFALTTYSKGYSELPTVSDQGSGWGPQEASHWRTETIDISNYVSTNTVFRFVQTNGYGNGLFIDNVRIVDSCPVNFTADIKVPCADENVQFTYLSGPATAWTWSFSPNTVTFQNGTTANSTHPIVSFDAVGSYDVALTTTITDGDVSTTKSNYIIRPNTTANQPFEEKFESGVPPANWLVINPDNSEGWESTTTVGIDGNTSNVARMDNYQYNAPGQKDYLVMPQIDLSPYCNPALVFEVAYAAYGPNNSEQLDVEYATGCNTDFALTTYSKGYSELPTVSDQGSGWGPQEASHWRTETIDISNYVSTNTVFRFVQTNGYGNGLFIDNVRIVSTCPVLGCLDNSAHNYNPFVTQDDGSCETCSDGVMNGDETGVDCGGSLCSPCQGCTDANAHNYDPIATVDDGSCLTCNDGVMNGDETGVDCGGSLCAPCQGCTDANAHNYDPIATVDDGSCLTCSDGVMNGDETGVDCGGAICAPCQGCTDANAHNYDPIATVDDGSCLTCSDGVMNGDETGVDCGGSLCAPCQGCTDANAHNYDPIATVDDGSCLTCSDGVMNGDETGVDCGGSLCAPCQGCTDANAHNYDPIATVDDGSCLTCSDGVMNGDETGVDCGGSLCAPCQGCTDANAHNYDPIATVDDGSCLTCSDGVMNGDETGVDCGGSLCAPCQGCTDANAHNYDPIATVDDGSCLTCNDGVMNGDETGVDCGGSLCSPCQGCTDANAHNYDPIATVDDESCQTCSDGIMNGDETGVDCGGTLCAPCQGCTDANAHNYDPIATVDDGSCLTCSDGIMNGDETGIDCGGSRCAPCQGCTDANAHNYDPVATVDDGSCQTCSDGVMNGNETGIDCGSALCTPCQGCTDANAHNFDPIATVDDGSCQTCSDGVMNGDETDIDCGGALCAPCSGDCPPTQILAGTIVDEAKTVEAINTITSAERIMGISDVTYLAGTSILLETGFEVELGSEFLATMGNCAAINDDETVEFLENEDKTILATQEVMLHLFPNPFQESVHIAYQLNKATTITLELYAVNGQRVATIIPNNWKEEGEHKVTFNGSSLKSGVYFVRLVTPEALIIEELVLIR